MTETRNRPVEVIVVAVPETAGSALYGMVDVLLAAGNIWQTLVRTEPADRLFDVRILSVDGRPFECGNGVPVQPALAATDDPVADVVILPELWLGPDEDLEGRYPAVIEWIRRRHDGGAHLYSACSGAIMLAATGLLDGRAATSHWGYADLFRRRYPKIEFRPEPNLVFADPDGRIVTAGGTTSWHDLALHIIARHGNPGEALRIAKVYLFKWHGEGQLPYGSLLRHAPHADSMVRECEDWLADHFREDGVIQRLVTRCEVAERTLKRRFKQATGSSLIDYLQNLRVEEAKRMLETGRQPVDEISFEVGYEDPSFFRRLFKRRTGLTPSRYRRLFSPMLGAATGAAGNGGRETGTHSPPAPR